MVGLLGRKRESDSSGETCLTVHDRWSGDILVKLVSGTPGRFGGLCEPLGADPHAVVVWRAGEKTRGYPLGQ